MTAPLRYWVTTWQALLIFCSTVVASGQVAAQAPTWQAVSAVSQAAGNGSVVTDVTTDAAGNVYLVGRFTNTAIFGTVSLVSAGSSDIFVAKWAGATKTFVWAQRAGGTKVDNATGITLAGSSVYITGSFASAACAFGSTVLSGPGSSSVLFIAKLTDTGTTTSFVWAKQAGVDPTANGTSGQSITAAGSALYLTGSFVEIGIFDAITLRATGTSPSLSSGFVAKVQDDGATGSFVWAKAMSRGVEPQRIACNGPAVYIAGYFDGPNASFDTTTLANASPDPNAGISDAFITKVTDSGTTGTFTWAQIISGTGYDELYGLAVRGTALYVAGNFSSPTLPVGATTLVNSTTTGTNDVLIAKLTDLGSTVSVAWAQQAGGSDEDGALGIAVNGNQVYATGFFSSGTATFGPTALPNSTAGTNDLFVTRLTDRGSTCTFTWAQKAGGNSSDIGFNVAVSNSQLYVGGQVSAPASFGSFTLANTTNSGIGFLATLTDDTALTATVPASVASAPYPNPAHAKVTVMLPASRVAKTLYLLDALGRVAGTDVVSPANTTVDFNLAGVAPGIYTLRVATTDTVTATRLVVY